MKINRLILFFALVLALSACALQPSVVVVTATPAEEATPTREVVVLASSTPSVTPRPSRTPHGDCARTNLLWDSNVSGCIVNLNPALNQGAAFVSVRKVGVYVPNTYSLFFDGVPPRTVCTFGACKMDVSYTSPQAVLGYAQPLAVELNQCYLVKATYQFEYSFTTGHGETPLFAGSRANLNAFNYSQFPAGSPKSAGGGFEGQYEYVAPYKATTVGALSPVLTVALKVQWGVLFQGSSVTLNSIYVFAAPDGYCEDGHNSFD